MWCDKQVFSSAGQLFIGMATCLCQKTNKSYNMYKQEIKLVFPTKGTSKTPAHTFARFSLKLYYPRVFQKLRGLWNLDEDKYLASLDKEQKYATFLSKTKKDQFFFRSSDEEYFLKSISLQEFHVLRDVIKSYREHFIRYPSSLLARITSLFKLATDQGQTYFVVMQNIKCSGAKALFDLKGTDSRSTDAEEWDLPGHIFKDQDLLSRNVFFDVSPSAPSAVALVPDATQLRQNIFKDLHFRVVSDAQFLKNHGLTDYSLIVALHPLSREAQQLKNQQLLQSDASSPFDPSQGLLASDGTSMMFLGVVDFLVSYKNIAKTQSNVTSAVRYADRWKEFIVNRIR